jgi:hypothetical protein
MGMKIFRWYLFIASLLIFNCRAIAQQCYQVFSKQGDISIEFCRQQTGQIVYLRVDSISSDDYWEPVWGEVKSIRNRRS